VNLQTIALLSGIVNPLAIKVGRSSDKIPPIEINCLLSRNIRRLPSVRY
jgi:hypothetical protein